MCKNLNTNISAVADTIKETGGGGDRAASIEKHEGTCKFKIGWSIKIYLGLVNDRGGGGACY